MNRENFFRNLPELVTNRTVLRKINLFDTQDIFEYACKQEVSKYLFWDIHKNTITTRKFISNVMQNYNDGKESPWGIVFKENQKLIGTVGFNLLNEESGTAEIGYVLLPDYWNLGIMTEVVNELKNYGIEFLGLKRIEAKCEPGNTASQKVLTKAGFKLINRISKVKTNEGKIKTLLLFSFEETN